MSTLVTIIIPVYNRGDFLPQTLNSISNQSYSNWECIIVDDHSTDNSVEIAHQYVAKDKRFRCYKRPDSMPKGANSCRNFGFDLSEGVMINWFDSDDIMHQDFIFKKVHAFEDDDLDGVISKTKMFNEDITDAFGKENRTRLTENLLEDFLTLKISWYLPDVMWRKTFLKDKELFDLELLAGQDRDFHTRKLLESPNLKVIDEYLTYYRVHDNNITANVNSLNDVTLKISHLKSTGKLIDTLATKGFLRPALKTQLFISLIKYLPYVRTNKTDLKLLRNTLRKLSFRSIAIMLGWFKFYLSLYSFKLFGKGERLLK